MDISCRLKTKEKIDDFIDNYFEPRPNQISYGWDKRIVWMNGYGNAEDQNCICVSKELGLNPDEHYQTFQQVIHEYETKMLKRGFLIGGHGGNPTYYFIASPKDEYEALLIIGGRLGTAIGHLRKQNYKLIVAQQNWSLLCDIPTLQKELGEAINLQAIIGKHQKLIKKEKTKKASA